MARKFTPPWTVHHSDSAWWVQDVHGRQFCYTYFRKSADQPDAPHLLSFDEARRIVSNVAKLPDLLKTDE